MMGTSLGSMFLMLLSGCIALMYSQIYQYWIISIHTGGHQYAGTDANIYIKIVGEFKTSRKLILKKHPSGMKPNAIDVVHLKVEEVGTLKGIIVYIDAAGPAPRWLLKEIELEMVGSEMIYTFVYNMWLWNTKISKDLHQKTRDVIVENNFTPSSDPERTNALSALEGGRRSTNSADSIPRTVTTWTEIQGITESSNIDKEVFYSMPKSSFGVSSAISASAVDFPSAISASTPGISSNALISNPNTFVITGTPSLDAIIRTTDSRVSSIETTLGPFASHEEKEVSASTDRLSTLCSCPCSADSTPSGGTDSVVLSEKERRENLQNLLKGMAVDKKTLSSYIRKKTSASDHRPSAKAVGGFGVVMLVVPFAIIFLLDLLSLVGYLSTRNQ